MAKRPSKHLRPHRPLSLGLSETSARKADGTWIIRPVTSERAMKDYVCPGCQHQVPAGAAHIVVWPAVPPLGSRSGIEHRRHWHSTCWIRRP